jgi:hypothetical protein
MRLQFVVALAIGWPMAVRRAPPQIVFWGFMAVSALLAVILGLRLNSSLSKRAVLVLLFFAGGTFVASYSAFIARTVQPPEPPYPPGTHPWATLDALPAAAFVVFGFPIAIVAVAYMLRLWNQSTTTSDA